MTRRRTRFGFVCGFPCLCGELEHVRLLEGNGALRELDGLFRIKLPLLLLCKFPTDVPGVLGGSILPSALQAALAEGHDKVVKILVDAGADVNAQGGHFGNALQAASAKGRDKVAQILMDMGVDVNAQGGDSGNALQAALYRGHDKVVQMLIDAGAGT